MLAAAAVVATSIVAIDSVVSTEPARAANPLFCNGTGVYVSTSNGQVREFKGDNGSFTPADTFNITQQRNNG